jgi:hypothetical protein
MRTLNTRLVFIFVFGIWCLLSAAEAAVWENIPVFPNAQKVKQENVIIDNKPVYDAIYTTNAPIGEVLEFYKSKMANFGWSMNTESIQADMGIAVFGKGGAATNVTVQSIMGKNFITVVQTQAPELSDNKPCAECDQKMGDELMKQLESVPEGVDPAERLHVEPEPGAGKIPTEDTPGKDLQTVPRYPGATRMNSAERNNGKKAALTYFSTDTVEKIESFYRQNMSTYNWALEKEVNFQDAPREIYDKMGISLTGESLVFKNRFASCIISIFKEPQGKGTIIGVNYDEK